MQCRCQQKAYCKNGYVKILFGRKLYVMLVLPAIDIKDGTCVRLYKGDYSTAHKVAESAVDTAKKFEADGAKWLHMVDLDGAKDGKRVNSDLILSVRKNCGLNIEVGGGIRDMEAVEFYLNNGIDRVILGSAAIKDPDFVKEAVRKYPSKIAVSIDARDGMVSADGWTDTSEVDYIELAKQMEDIGVQYIIFTDISKDGMLQGPNTALYKSIMAQWPDCRLIASGGVSSKEDIRALDEAGIPAVVFGKAIYEGRIDLASLIKEYQAC